MGEAEIDLNHDTIIITSHIITYGNAADENLTALIREEIETMWNEPKGIVSIRENKFMITFSITAELQPSINMEAVFNNTDPRNNYFRIEEYAHGNISFVDGLGCNSGYFKLENLYKGSTTAAHEYGHTLGLDHPKNTDLRGKGVPGIMYPRGTLVDPLFQYEPDKAAGTKGGTMHPMHRKVKQEDIALLNLHKLDFQNNIAILGEFTSVWHDAHTP